MDEISWIIVNGIPINLGKIAYIYPFKNMISFCFADGGEGVGSTLTFHAPSDHQGEEQIDLSEEGFEDLRAWVNSLSITGYDRCIEVLSEKRPEEKEDDIPF